MVEISWKENQGLVMNQDLIALDQCRPSELPDVLWKSIMMNVSFDNGQMQAGAVSFCYWDWEQTLTATFSQQT